MRRIAALTIVAVLCAVCSPSLARRHGGRHRGGARQQAQPQPYYEPDVYDNYDDVPADVYEYEQPQPRPYNNYQNQDQDTMSDDMSDWEDWENPAEEPVDEGWGKPVDDGIDEEWEVNPDETIDAGYGIDPVQEQPEDDIDGAYNVEPPVQWADDNVEEDDEAEEEEQLEERKPWFDDQVELRHEPVPAPLDTEGQLMGADEIPEDAIEQSDDSDETEDLDDESEDVYIEPDTLVLGNVGIDTSEEYDEYGSESAAVSDETSEEMDVIEDGDLIGAEEEDVNNWPEQDDEVSSEEEFVDDTPLQESEPIVETDENGIVDGVKEELRQPRGPFTTWHYAIFAVAGAVFMLGVMIMVAAAVKSIRSRSPIYRQLKEQGGPVNV